MAVFILDPWGPISAVLFQLGDSEAVKDIVSSTGVIVDWSDVVYGLMDGDKVRIRKLRPSIEKAYQALDAEQKGVFAQIVAKQLIQAQPDLKVTLDMQLNEIGWSMSSGTLSTPDVILSEQFFPAGTVHDAYVAIRDILHRASSDLLIVDAYLSESILKTIASGPNQELTVRFLTTEKGLKQRPDFFIEIEKFKAQFAKAKPEVRTTPEFHDRFVAVNQCEYYHVGASIKNAGERAFLISRLEDQPVVEAIRTYIESAWHKSLAVT